MEHIDAVEVAKTLWTVVVSLASVIGVIYMRRVHKLEENSATKSEMNEKFDALRSDIHADRSAAETARKEMRDEFRDHRQETRDGFTRVFEKFDDLMSRRFFGGHR